MPRMTGHALACLESIGEAYTLRIFSRRHRTNLLLLRGMHEPAVDIDGETDTFNCTWYSSQHKPMNISFSSPHLSCRRAVPRTITPALP